MKSYICLGRVAFFSAILGICSLLHADAGAEKLSDHSFFKHFIGSWKAGGDLKGADGNIVTVKEEWTGKLGDDGGLVIEGTRDINNGDPQKYCWTITHNATTDLFEAVLSNPDDPGHPLRFEGSITGEPAVLELKAQVGNGGTINVTDTFLGEDHRSFETKVVFIGDTGNVTLEGTLKNERTD